jgi:hypothetical protein
MRYFFVFKTLQIIFPFIMLKKNFFFNKINVKNLIFKNNKA